MTNERCVLAYSGGLDTSVAIRWLQEHLGYDVITLTADLGESAAAQARQKKIAKMAHQLFIQGSFIVPLFRSISGVKLACNYRSFNRAQC